MKKLLMLCLFSLVSSLTYAQAPVLSTEYTIRNLDAQETREFKRLLLSKSTQSDSLETAYDSYIKDINTKLRAARLDTTITSFNIKLPADVTFELFSANVNYQDTKELKYLEKQIQAELEKKEKARKILKAILRDDNTKVQLHPKLMNERIPPELLK